MFILIPPPPPPPPTKGDVAALVEETIAYQLTPSAKQKINAAIELTRLQERVKYLEDDKIRLEKELREEQRRADPAMTYRWDTYISRVEGRRITCLFSNRSASFLFPLFQKSGGIRKSPTLLLKNLFSSLIPNRCWRTFHSTVALQLCT